MHKLILYLFAWIAATLAIGCGAMAYFAAQSESDKWLASAVVAAAGGVLWKCVADDVRE